MSKVLISILSNLRSLLRDLLNGTRKITRIRHVRASLLLLRRRRSVVKEQVVRRRLTISIMSNAAQERLGLLRRNVKVNVLLVVLARGLGHGRAGNMCSCGYCDRAAGRVLALVGVMVRRVVCVTRVFYLVFCYSLSYDGILSLTRTLRYRSRRRHSNYATASTRRPLRPVRRVRNLRDGRCRVVGRCSGRHMRGVQASASNTRKQLRIINAIS